MHSITGPSTAKANTKLKGPLETSLASLHRGRWTPVPHRSSAAGCQPACTLLSLEQERACQSPCRAGRHQRCVGWETRHPLSSRTKRSPNYRGKHPSHINRNGSQNLGQISSEMHILARKLVFNIQNADRTSKYGLRGLEFVSLAVIFLGTCPLASSQDSEELHRDTNHLRARRGTPAFPKTNREEACQERVPSSRSTGIFLICFYMKIGK